MLEVHEKAYDDFRRAIRAEARALFLGLSDLFLFTDSMLSALQRGYRQAWLEGSSSCGITEDELKESELQAIENAVNRDAAFLPRYADWILDQARAEKKISTVLARADLWANAYNGLVAEAKLVTCSDQKYRWDVGPTEHCSDCMAYWGRVHRGSVWNAVGARPQSRALECGGYNCQCKLNPTDEKAWSGRPPKPSGA